ncbi:putative copper-translocating P-type ATPase [Bifidobacterium actinocoloniiforme DSM 22766]|uniref:Putative copper-translocating P-type ATPase n=1 Tax=Bifidobacterium actinocoloniiforme DSM 22766 TaxID=1437605 RepID=A0A086Z279_9BIFI|nr:hypothetical protein [Bifidobacterium actinocoloniiforme]AKV55651.1 hypothetical protein AB656_04985 [Bifidobacterium actinocoloniiforme DSM 22766]KFI40629.1 putative copper-translocating P-type ATPase [Bifidobacterium actinocoloniiforme DSM 22766]
MGIDIFLAVGDILVAAALTWFIVWYFLSPHRRTRSGGASGERTAGQAAAASEARSNGPGLASRQEDLETLRRRTAKLTLASAILTAPVLAIDLCDRLMPGFLPSWLASPWIQAILITPVVFYCGRPVCQEGWARLRARQTDLNSLVSIATALAYAYSLAACALTGLLPEGSRQPYFDVVGAIMTLALFARLCELSAHTAALTGRLGPSYDQDRGQALTSSVAATLSKPSSAQLRVERLIARAEPLVMIVAVWTFMIWLLAGPQPHLAHAVANAVGVLIIACPTALAISVSLTFRTALGAGLAHGMLFTSPRSMGHLAATQVAVLDESALGPGLAADEDSSAAAPATATADNESPDGYAQEPCAELARASTHLRGLGVKTVVMDGGHGADPALGHEQDPVERAARQAGVDYLFTGVDGRRKARWVGLIAQDLNRAATQEVKRKKTSRRPGLVAFAALGNAEPQARQAAQVRIRLGSVAAGQAERDADAAAGAATAEGRDAAEPELLLAAGDLGGIGRAIDLARAARRTMNQNLCWGYAYNLVAVALATGVTYPLFGWMLNPMVAPVATAIAALLPMFNVRRLGRLRRLSRRWRVLARVQPELLPTLAAHRPQVIADGGRRFTLRPEGPDRQPGSADRPESGLPGSSDLPDQTRQ